MTGLKSFAAVIVVGVLGGLPARAHLCNDVFVQAKDNLAVKVDIRDDQLRLDKSASFRVYLLNTMDRDIANIQLAVRTDDFDARVKPSEEWKGFPALKTAGKGGKKEYFEVELARKAGTAQGKYKIELHLFNGRNKSMVFKTVDIAEAMAAQAVPQTAPPPTIDGNIEPAEWQKGLLLSALYEYKKKAQFYENCTADVQTRFRFLQDGKRLYGAIDFQQEGGGDKARIYLAPDVDGKSVVVEANLQGKSVTIDGMPVGEVRVAVAGTKMEVSIPLDKLNLAGAKSFCLNVTRTQDDTVTYWRGNRTSVADPVVFADCRMN